MGYTHYWTRKGEIDRSTWSAICADVRALVAKAPFPVVEDDDIPDHPPIVTSQVIRFNGPGDRGCQTFIMDRCDYDNDWGNVCKTRHRPYDSLVVATLAIIAERAPGQIEVKSNGDALDWQSGLEWASSVLGRTIPLPLKVKPSHA